MNERRHETPDQQRNDAADERRPERVRPPDRGATVPVDRARGGVSLWSVLSGVLVAFGAFLVIAAIVGAVFAALGIAEGGLRTEELTGVTIGAGVGLVIVQFLAYLWGGYTAGRMARGSGVVNGILVPVVAIVIIIALGAILSAFVGAEQPDVQRLPLPLDTVRDIGTGVGIGLLVAMLAGGTLGGWLGARWHTKLENSEAHAGLR